MATTFTLHGDADYGDKKVRYGVLVNAGSAMSAADLGLQHIDFALVASDTATIFDPQYSVSGGTITLAVQSGASYATFKVAAIGW